MKRTALALSIALAMSACSMMPDVKVEGIDNLKVTEIELSPLEVASKCTQLMGMPSFMMVLTTPLACANIWLENWSCDIYYSKLFAGISLEHEREHCRGKWHDDGLRIYRDAYRSNLERDL